MSQPVSVAEVPNVELWPVPLGSVNNPGLCHALCLAWEALGYDFNPETRQVAPKQQPQ